MASLKTPLKVTHAQACGAAAPTLTLQLPTVVESLTVGGYDVADLLYKLGAGSDCDVVQTPTSCTSNSEYDSAYLCSNAYDGIENAMVTSTSDQSGEAFVGSSSTSWATLATTAGATLGCRRCLPTCPPTSMTPIPMAEPPRPASRFL